MRDTMKRRAALADFGIAVSGYSDNELEAVMDHSVLSSTRILVARAAADAEAFFADCAPRPYSRTVLALGVMTALERMINSDSPVRGPAREVLAESAFDFWLAIAPRDRL